MNYISLRRLFIPLAAVVLGSSCTKDFKSYNTSNLEVNIDLISASTHMQRAIYNFSGGGDPNSFQVQQNLNADVFSGYMMGANPFNGGKSNLNYFMMTGWNGEPFKVGYLDVMRYAVIIKNMGVQQNYPAIWAITQVLQVAAMSRVTDIYGPVPYSKAGPLLNGATGTPYDSQKDVYAAFFVQLDSAVNTLKTFIAGGKVSNIDFSTMDLVYGSNKATEYENWLRYANSLRLRLAMRTVKIDKPGAQAQAEKALDPNNGGVITDNSQIMQVSVAGDGLSNPLVQIAENWMDTNIGASIACYMTGYNDPRTGRYFDKSTDANFTPRYIGIRIGSNTGSKDAYTTYSSINFKDGSPSFNFKTPPVLMTAAEVYFLRAEAALRGWNNAGGSVQSLYEQGIATSFAQWGVASSASTYINDNASVPDAYVDPKNSVNDAPSPTTVTVKWDDGASNEVKLERIITQKWIANFPEGQEAWSEFRRTGYPKLFPVVNNNSGGLISTSVQIRRLPFPQNEYNSNNAEVLKGVTLLGNGQADNGGSRLWWDVAGSNF